MCLHKDVNKRERFATFDNEEMLIKQFDGINLNLYITRNYFVKRENKTYMGDLGDKDFSIKNG